MCAYKKKTWKEKLQTAQQPRLEKADKDFAGIKAGQLMLIPTPLLVDAYIRQIPYGVEVSVAQLRKDLAAEYHAECTCPLTTGIFLRIAAEAAYEEYKDGKPLKEVTPFWRVLSEGAPAAKKLTFGVAFLAERRKSEGLGAHKKTKAL